MPEATTVLAILAALAAFGAAIKALPIFWDFLKGLVRFFTGLEKVSQLPDSLAKQEAQQANIPVTLKKIGDSVDQLGADLIVHTEEEEVIREEQKQFLQDLVDNVMGQNSEVFRQTTFASEIAYGEMVRIEGVDEDNPEIWQWSWVNTAFTQLSGLTQPEAASFGWVETISEDDRARVVPEAMACASAGLDIDIEFIMVNIRTKESTPVRVVASALTDQNNRPIRYLGAIYTMSGGVNKAIQSGFSAISRQAATSSPVAHYELRLNYTNDVFELVWANTAWEKLIGLTYKVAKVSYWEVLDPEDAETLGPELVHAGKAGKDINVEYDITNAKTGFKSSVRMIGYPVFTSGGRVSGYFGSIYITKSEDPDVTITSNVL